MVDSLTKKAGKSCWDVVPFDRVLQRLNGKQYQLPTADYQITGKYPIIDQGQKPIVGFSDKSEKVFNSPPEGVIVFGDHTCITKFVQFNFIIGADGTQILVGKNDQCTRFHAYQLEHKGISSTGYNRHFKFLKERLFFAPPTSEQRHIAQVLSNTDAYIKSLEQLIAKKQAIKQGAMRLLLTGKKRLSGFKGEWSWKTLAQTTDCLDNIRIPLNEAQRAKKQGIYPYCGANGILDYIDSYLIDDNIILLAEDGGYYDEYQTRPIAYQMYGKCWVNNHAHILKAKPGFNQSFLFYSLVHKNIQPSLASGTRAKLNRSELDKIETNFPNDEAEQEAIAKVIGDMDANLATLNAKLEKVRLIKQGMLHSLLSVKIRLNTSSVREPVELG